MSKAISRNTQIRLVTDEGRYQANAPLFVIDSKNSLILAGIVGSSTVIRGMIGALRSEKNLHYTLPGGESDLLNGSIPFRVFHEKLGARDENAERLAMLVVNPKSLNRVELPKGSEDGEKEPEKPQKAFAFGPKVEEIAFDLSDQLDIPLLPSWAETFVRRIRNEGWLKRIPSSGIEFAWEFEAKRTEYLTLLASGLGHEYLPQDLDAPGWKVRSLPERIRDSIRQQESGLFEFGDIIDGAVKIGEVDFGQSCLEESLIEHRSGKCSKGFEPVTEIIGSNGGFRLTTIHRLRRETVRITTEVIEEESVTTIRTYSEKRATAA